MRYEHVPVAHRQNTIIWEFVVFFFLPFALKWDRTATTEAEQPNSRSAANRLFQFVFPLSQFQEAIELDVDHLFHHRISNSCIICLNFIWNRMRFQKKQKQRTREGKKKNPNACVLSEHLGKHRFELIRIDLMIFGCVELRTHFFFWIDEKKEEKWARFSIERDFEQLSHCTRHRCFMVSCSPHHTHTAGICDCVFVCSCCDAIKEIVVVSFQAVFFFSLRPAATKHSTILVRFNCDFSSNRPIFRLFLWSVSL